MTVFEELTGEARVITAIPEAARVRWRMDDLVTNTVAVDGRPASYSSGGRGLPVLFLHGWGLDHRPYERSLRRLTARHCHVLSPSLPGFGGTAELPRQRRSLSGYAQWVDRFLDAVGVDEPVVVLGHSFGGGVATKFVHDHPEHARYLVLLNSVGDPRSIPANALSRVTRLCSVNPLRPALEAFRPSADGLLTTSLIQKVLFENFVRNPLGVARSAWLAMSADLTTEMVTLAERKLPVLVLWSDRDGIIPLSAFDTFCSTFGTVGHVVRGGHSWLLANPDVFGEVLDNVIHAQSSLHGVPAATANTSQLRELLGQTTVPSKVIARLIAGASPLWVLSESPAVLAADLALCHPRLRPGEVRAVARRMPVAHTFRLTVVAGDRPGLLADTAATLANSGASVVTASVMTWPAECLALHAITVRFDSEFEGERWAAIGKRLREMAGGVPATYPFVPCGRARVTRTGEGVGKSIVRVTAPDALGLLSAACRWFGDQGVSIEAASIATEDGLAKDVFLVDGECDVEALARRLSGVDISCPLGRLLRAVR